MKMDGLAYQNSKKILRRAFRKGAGETSGNVTRDISQNTLPFRDNVKFQAGEAVPAKEEVGRAQGHLIFRLHYDFGPQAR